MPVLYVFIIILSLLLPPSQSHAAFTAPYAACFTPQAVLLTSGSRIERLYMNDRGALRTYSIGRDGNYYEGDAINNSYYADDIREAFGKQLLYVGSFSSHKFYIRQPNNTYIALTLENGANGNVFRTTPVTLATISAQIRTCASDAEPTEPLPCRASPTRYDVASDVPLAAAPAANPSRFARQECSTVTATRRSGLPWNSGDWVNGSDDQLKTFETMRGRASDSVTQSMHGQATWAQQAGALTEADVDREFRQSRTNFTPSFEGIFKDAGWMKHVWGSYPATEHRKRIIHLAWQNVLPAEKGNSWDNKAKRYSNPRAWRDVVSGSGDKYMFLLGRKFAYLDAQYGDTNVPMTLDVGYEWTLAKHPDLPEGSYMDGATLRYAYQDFPQGWSRLVRVFKEGYKYQRGKACNYRFSWRPQLRFIVDDRSRADARIIPHNLLWANRAQQWAIVHDKVIDGVTVLPAGLMGKQADLLAVSWHDSSAEFVRGQSATEPGNNWQAILAGFPTHWGLQQAAYFAQNNGVKLAMPEWSANNAEVAKHNPNAVSPNPGALYKFTFAFFQKNKDNLAYENVFDIGTGDLHKGPWKPAQPANLEPRTIYKQLWGK